ncbi:hypothetical protein [Periweissella fabalis]|uniref:Uncharacterized protein n=1 Tax=Periweissella fabalis TaxID=1070421 RepID=A0A7X6N4U6_9LACO|nr:hypothetical protein [Periweissella fabalis]MCM0598450.1 hypothetical protein [Periweissella fabalis]NKZ25065.1 hypothetical protein [Periweissella fabalis]
MSTRKNILDVVQEHIDNGERVLVTVGDFGTQEMAVTNQVVTIHCVFVSKNDRMHYLTELVDSSKEKVYELLNAIQEKVSPFYFKSELSPEDYMEFSNLFKTDF